MERRGFLISAAAGAAAVGLPRCGGSATGDPPPRIPGAVAWSPSQLLFLAGSFSSIDLAQTLPAGVRLGGVFALAPNSGPLPPGLALSPSGLLSAADPSVSTASNVIFTYQEP